MEETPRIEQDLQASTFPSADIQHRWDRLLSVLQGWARKHPQARLPFHSLLKKWTDEGLRKRFIWRKAVELIAGQLAWEFRCEEQEKTDYLNFSLVIAGNSTNTVYATHLFVPPNNRLPTLE